MSIKSKQIIVTSDLLQFDRGSSEILNLLKNYMLTYPQISYWKSEIFCWSQKDHQLMSLSSIRVYTSWRPLVSSSSIRAGDINVFK
jgi:hypothetical protein